MGGPGGARRAVPGRLVPETGAAICPLSGARCPADRPPRCWSAPRRRPGRCGRAGPGSAAWGGPGESRQLFVLSVGEFNRGKLASAWHIERSPVVCETDIIPKLFTGRNTRRGPVPCSRRGGWRSGRDIFWMVRAAGSGAGPVGSGAVAVTGYSRPGVSGRRCAARHRARTVPWTLADMDATPGPGETGFSKKAGCRAAWNGNTRDWRAGPPIDGRAFLRSVSRPWPCLHRPGERRGRTVRRAWPVRMCRTAPGSPPSRSSRFRWPDGLSGRIFRSTGSPLTVSMVLQIWEKPGRLERTAFPGWVPTAGRPMGQAAGRCADLRGLVVGGVAASVGG